MSGERVPLLPTGRDQELSPFTAEKAKKSSSWARDASGESRRPHATPMIPVVVSEKHKLHELQAGRRVALLREISVSSFDEGFSTIKLRQIFRAFDLDHDGHIAHRELQEGLLALGFKEAANFSAINQVLSEIDIDRAGCINEREFIQYFQKLSKRELTRKLAAYGTCSSPVVVTVTEYGPLEGAYHELVLSGPDLQQFPRWLEERCSADDPRNMWIDIDGYDETILQCIAHQFGFHSQTVKDAAIFQRSKMTVMTSKHKDLPAEEGNDDLGDVREEEDGESVDTAPFIERSPSNGSYLTGKFSGIRQFQRRGRYTMARAGSYVQAQGNDALTPSNTVASGAPASMGNNSRAVPSAAAPLRTSFSLPRAHTLLRAMSDAGGGSRGGEEEVEFEDLRAQLILHVMTLNSHLPTSEGKLAPAKVIQRTPPCITMDQISLLLVNHSIVITIHNCCSSDATGSLRSVFQDVFKPIRCSLQSSDGLTALRSSTVQQLSFEIMNRAMQKNFTVRDVLKEWELVLETTLKERPRPKHIPHLYAIGKLADQYTRHLSPLVEQLEPEIWSKSKLGSYFSDCDMASRELYDVTQSIVESVHSTIKTAEGLKTLHAALQNEQMNRVLYVLTLVTTVIIPAQFLQGLYGMMLPGIPEQSWKYGYPFFWVLVVLLTLGMYVVFRRWNLLSM